MPSAESQRRMCGRIEFPMGMIAPFPAWLDKIGDAVAFPIDARGTDPVADGRYDEPFPAFENLFGSERAEALPAGAVKEWHGGRARGRSAVEVRGPTRAPVMRLHPRARYGHAEG